MKKYRLNAGVVLFRRDGKVLLCQRVESYSKNWQFPQGGIDAGETALEAARRELREETSVVSAKFVSALSEVVCYDFPEDVKCNLAKKGIVNDGQEQYWHLFFFEGNDDEINLQTEEPEFQAYRWVDIKESLSSVVEFKYHIYEKIVAEFSQVINDYICSL